MPNLHFLRGEERLAIRGARFLPALASDDFRVTRRHLHELSRLNDCTVSLEFADAYFCLQRAWLRCGGCTLRPQVFVALKVVGSLKHANRLLAELAKRQLSGLCALTQVRSETLKESLYDFVRRGTVFVPGGEERLCQILRLHRAEYWRCRLFCRYLDEQRQDYAALHHASLRQHHAPQPQRQLGSGAIDIGAQKARLRDNLAWAERECNLVPSRRLANGHRGPQRDAHDPLLPHFSATLPHDERTLCLYPPPNAFAGARSSAPPPYAPPPSPQPWRCIPA